MKDVCILFLKDSIVLSFINEQGVLCFVEAENIEQLKALTTLSLN